MKLLGLNAGSSSLKFALFDESAANEIASGLVDWRGRSETATLAIQTPAAGEKRTSSKRVDTRGAVAWILRTLLEYRVDDPVDAVAYRVVHGGTEFLKATLIDDTVSQSLERISTLAPLHNPPALATIAATRDKLPQAAHVAVFDTAFFASLPRRSILYPVPYDWFEQYGIRRFGFHGISHSYCASRAGEFLKRQDDAGLRLVICHLGNGCSATAVRGGQPVETTMGFTPLEGLMMGTRSGSIDPGILLHLIKQKGFSADQLDETLNRRSGLLGVSGVSSDFREVEAEAASGNPRARLAIDMFASRIRGTVGALAATLGGIDALVFTGGIGQHSASLRSEVCDGLQCLDLSIDDRKNQELHGDSDIAADRSTNRILVLQTREEKRAVQEAVRLLAR